MSAPSVTDDKAPEFLVIREVAEMLRLSEKSIYRLLTEEPSLPHIRVGRGALRFPRVPLQRWLERRTAGPARRRGVA